MAKEEKCLFCEIISGSVPTLKVYENEFVLAVLSIKPATKGHILLIPKQHHTFIQTVPEDVLFQMMVAVKSLTAILTQVLQAGGVNVLYSMGSMAGQKLGHVHFDVIPRYKKNDVKIDLPETMGDENELREIQRIIVSAFRESTIKLLKDIKEGKFKVDDNIRKQAEKALEIMEKEAPPKSPFKGKDKKGEKLDVLKLEDELKKV